MKYFIAEGTGVGAGKGDWRGKRERREVRRRSLLGLGLGLALVCGVVGCHKTAAQNPNDPANANLAQPGYNGVPPAQALGQNDQAAYQAQGEDYSQQPPAPIERQGPPGYYDPNAGYDAAQQNADLQAEDAYVSDLTDEQASEPPPPLPDYDQPYCPGPDYIWTPGYWAWGPYGYYWVPGAWVEAPYAGALWTPGYWAFVGGFYRFHHGFWGRHIGFYGGINYGFGYTGFGYDGGYWNGDRFYYNTVYSRVNINVIRNVYVYRGGNTRFAGGVSFNGGRGGVQAQPRPAELAVLHEQRNAPVAAQQQLQQRSAGNRQQFYSQNKGRPEVAVSASPIVSDHRMPAALPRAAAPAQARGPQPDAVEPQNHPGQAQYRPQPQPQPEAARPAQPQYRPGMEQRGPQPSQAAPQNRPQPESRMEQPQYRPQPEAARPAQPQPRPEAQPQYRPQPQSRPQPQPQPESRPAPPQAQYRPQPQPQPQARPQPPQPQAQPRPQAAPPQARPQSQPQPQHQAPPPRPDDKKDDHPHP